MLFYELSTRCHLVLHWVMALERWVCHLQAFNFQSAGLLFWRGVLYFEPRSFLNLAKYFLVSKPNQQVTAKEQIDWKWKKSARENQSASHKCPNGMRAAVSWMIHLWHNSSTPPASQCRFYRPLKWEEPARSQYCWDYCVKAPMLKDT